MKLVPWKFPPLQAENLNQMKPSGMAPVLATYKNEICPLFITFLPDNSVSGPIWGLDFFEAFSVTSIKLEPPQLVSERTITQPPQPYLVALTETSDDDVTIRSPQSSESHPLDKIQFENSENPDLVIIQEALLAYSDVFSKSNTDIGKTETLKHRILLNDDKPVYRRPHRRAIRNITEMEETIDRLLKTGAIRPLKSPYTSPVFFVEKDHGQAKCLVADFRALNAKTIPDITPMPHQEDVFGILHGSSIFAKLDITSMFNQIQVDERDIEKTAITTPLRLFECPLMPFGLINAPANAVRLMKEVLRGLYRKICFLYFDDIIVYAAEICTHAMMH